MKPPPDTEIRTGYLKVFPEKLITASFRKRLGLSVVEYIRILRLEMSCMLLATGGGNIAQVGEQCGYSAANYFIRCFKERYGVTPAVFRRT